MGRGDMAAVGFGWGCSRACKGVSTKKRTFSPKLLHLYILANSCRSVRALASRSRRVAAFLESLVVANKRVALSQTRITEPLGAMKDTEKTFLSHSAPAVSASKIIYDPPDVRTLDVGVAVKRK